MFNGCLSITIGNWLPLSLRRSQQELRYTVKVKATKGHPASCITEFHWTTLSKNLNQAIFQYIQKLKKFFLDTPAQIVNPLALQDEPL